MTAKLKLAAYVILLALTIGFGIAFRSSYSKIDASTPDQPAQTNSLATPAPAPATAQTNVSDLSTNNPGATNDTASSNLVKQAATPTNTPPAPVANAAAPPPAKPGKSLVDLLGLVAALIGLGVLAAFDISQFLGSRAVDLLFNDQGEGQRDPEYEKAEQTWVNGRHLEAIQMMREYLAKHPRELYVSLRIAEIYEKDLRNYVAASLEYEEVLKKRLPAERWGWAAIHLCNIYTKLGKQDKTKALLERIARDYPKTGAAKKARSKLGLPGPDEAPAPVEETEEAAVATDMNAVPVFDLDEAIASTDEEAAAPPVKTQPKAPPPPDPAKPNLPPGFRPK